MMATHHAHCIAVMGIAHDAGAERLVWGVISDLSLVRGGVEPRLQRPVGVLSTLDLADVLAWAAT